MWQHKKTIYKYEYNIKLYQTINTVNNQWKEKKKRTTDIKEYLGEKKKNKHNKARTKNAPPYEHINYVMDNMLGDVKIFASWVLHM